MVPEPLLTDPYEDPERSADLADSPAAVLTEEQPQDHRDAARHVSGEA